MIFRNVNVEEYSSDWKKQFHKEKSHLFTFLNQNQVKVCHIGSTSVPGLAAKPVIDILIEAPCLDYIDTNNKNFISLGYEPCGEFGIKGRRFLRKGIEQRSHHIHAFCVGDPNLTRHISFKEYLINHSGIATEYAALKMEGVKKCNNDINIYMEYKNNFIVHHEKRALEWHKNLINHESGL